MVSCCICKISKGSRAHRETHFTFHKIPRNDYVRREWISFINKCKGYIYLDEDDTRIIYLCSEHFANESFEERFNKPFLKKNSIPTIRFICDEQRRHLLPNNNRTIENVEHIIIDDDSNNSFVQEEGTYQCDTGKHLSDNHVQCHRTCLEVVAEIRKQLQDQLNQWESFMMLSPLDLIVKGTAQIKTMKALIDKLEAAVSSCTTSETSNENSLDHSQHITMLDDNTSFRSTNSSQQIEKLTADTAQAHFQTLFKKITEGNRYI